MRSIGLIGICLLLFSCQKPTDPDVIVESYKYFITLPQNYTEEQVWPAILYLHGAGGGTADRDIYDSYGLGAYVEATPEFPFIVIAPQSEDEWLPGAIDELLNRVLAEYAVDENRIYITGFSLGGFGSFYMALEFPRRFAASAPVCGWGWPDRVCEIRHVPFWFFHNDGDPQISVNYSYDLYNALLGCNARDVRLTVYESDSHNAWNQAYHDPQLYQWFLSHRLDEEGRP